MATATATRPSRFRLATLLVAASMSAVIGAGAGIGSYALVSSGQLPTSDADQRHRHSGLEHAQARRDGGRGRRQDRPVRRHHHRPVRSGRRQGGGLGTGVVLDTDGHILTNDHVVSGAGQQGTIEVTFDDGTTAEATIVGTAETTDLAVIKVPAVGEPEARHLRQVGGADGRPGRGRGRRPARTCPTP